MMAFPMVLIGWFLAVIDVFTRFAATLSGKSRHEILEQIGLALPQE